MPENYQIIYDDGSRTVVIRVFGQLNAEAMIVPFCVVEEKHGIEDTNLLWDLTKCSFSDFSHEEILKAGVKRKEVSNLRKGNKTALFLNNDSKFQLAKLFKAANYDSEPILMIFTKPDDARAYFKLNEEIELSVS